MRQVGITSRTFSTGLALQVPEWSTLPPTEASPGTHGHQAYGPAIHRRNPDAEAFASERGLVAESDLAEVAASLLLSGGEGEAAPANLPALRATGGAGGADATSPDSPSDQDSLSAAPAVGLVVIGLASGVWARRASILHACGPRKGRLTSGRRSLGLAAVPSSPKPGA
jgi:hypothetical protein